MSTEGKEGFDHEVSFTFDYSDIDVKTRQVKKELSDFGDEVYRFMKGMDVDKSSGFIFPNLDKMYSTTLNGSINKALTILPDGKQIGNDMNVFAVAVSAESKETMKKYIGSRVDTGLMKASVYGRTERRAKKITSRAGWLDTWHKYFGFQEDGTYQIRPMHSVMRTYLEMAPWVQKSLNEYFRSYTRSGGYKR
jgi:hypothetical protein